MEVISNYCTERLLVAGEESELKKFDRDSSHAALHRATDLELIEQSRSRIHWQFVMDAPAFDQVRRLSKQWPRLTFILHYDCEGKCLMGLARLKNGRLRHHRLSY